MLYGAQELICTRRKPPSELPILLSPPPPSWSSLLRLHSLCHWLLRSLRVLPTLLARFIAMAVNVMHYHHKPWPPLTIAEEEEEDTPHPYTFPFPNLCPLFLRAEILLLLLFLLSPSPLQIISEFGFEACEKKNELIHSSLLLSVVSLLPLWAEKKKKKKKRGKNGERGSWEKKFKFFNR